MAKKTKPEMFNITSHHRNAKQNYAESPFYPELLPQRKQQMLANKEAEKKESLYTVDENVIWLASIITKNQKQERIY